MSLCALHGPSALQLRFVYVPSTFRLRSVLMLSLLCLFHRLRSNVCVPVHAFHDVPSNAFRHMRPSVCFQLHVFNCMRSTRCVPLYAFHCVSSTVLSEYMRSTTCVPQYSIQCVPPYAFECVPPRYAFHCARSTTCVPLCEFHLRIRMYWIHTQTKIRQ